MKLDKLKLLGLGATVVGFAVTLVSDYVGDKKLNTKVTEEVAKALADKKES